MYNMTNEQLIRDEIKNELRAYRARLNEILTLSRTKRTIAVDKLLWVLTANDDGTRALARLFDKLQFALAEKHKPTEKDRINCPNEIDEATGYWKVDVPQCNADDVAKIVLTSRKKFGD